MTEQNFLFIRIAGNPRSAVWEEYETCFEKIRCSSVFHIFFLLIKMPSEAADLKPSGDEDTFTNQMKLTTVLIDVNIMKGDSPVPIILNDKFDVHNGPAGQEEFKNAVKYKSIKQDDIGQKLTNSGDCFRYLYENAATLPDGTKADLLITYSDVNLYVSSYAADATDPYTANPNGFVIVANGNKLDTVPQENGNKNNSWYVGVEETVTVQVVEHGTTDPDTGDTTPVTGQDMFFWMNGINVTRGIESTDARGIHWRADNNNYNRIPEAKPTKYGWNEQVEISKSSLVDHIYYPAVGYVTAIANISADKVLFYGNGGENNTYTTGFATAANAGSGAAVTFRAGVGWNKSSKDLHNAVWPTKFDHTILSSSGDGGSIKTYKNGHEGSELLGGIWRGSGVPLPNNYYSGGAGLGDNTNGYPLMYVVPDGKPEVKYTMTPNPGYVIDKLYIDGKEVETPSINSDGTYTYTFKAGSENRSIHVTYKKIISLTVEKKWVDGNHDRPSSVDVCLKQNGNDYDSSCPTISASTGWKHTFHNLPEKDADGNLYTYTVEEKFADSDKYDISYSDPVNGSDGTITITITNFLIKSGNIPLIRKIIHGPAPREDDTYTFLLEPIGNAPLPDDGKTEITIKGTGTNKFGKITFRNNGVYEYEITEVVDPNGGYSNDTVYKVTFTVSAGTVEITGIEKNNEPSQIVDELEFVNHYPTPEGWAVPLVIKHVNADAMHHAETFEFHLERVTSDAPMPEGTVNGVKIIKITCQPGSGCPESNFGPADFTQNGVFEYRIFEKPGNSPDIQYDGNVYHAKVMVDKGKVTKEVWLEKSNGEREPVPADEDDIYHFFNTFAVYPEVNQAVRKDISGGKPAPSHRFYFRLDSVSNTAGLAKNPMPEGETSEDGYKIIYIDGEDVLNDAVVYFGVIKFPAIGEYTYKISEVRGDMEQYDYSTNFYTVTWNVHRENGEIIATPHITNRSGSVIHPEDLKDGAILFENVLKVEGANDNLQMEKKITGWDTEPSVTFSFTLTVDAYPKDVPALPLPPEHDNGSVACTYEKKNKETLVCTTNGSKLLFHFGLMEFLVDGTYEYTVREVKGDDPDIDYDEAVYKIIYTVKDGEVTKKTVTKNDKTYKDDDLLVFTNENHKRSESDSAHATPKVMKTVVGETSKEGDTFRFVLHALGNTAGLKSNPMPEKAKGDTMTIEVELKDGTDVEKTFGEITFTEAGVYEYEIYEEAGDLDRYEYDDVVYRVSYIVSAEDEWAPLTVVTEIEIDGYEDIHDEKTGEVIFENVKLPEPPAANPEVKKFVNGMPDYDEFFRFSLKGISAPKGVKNIPMPKGAEDGIAWLDLRGTTHGHFGSFQFPKNGEYVYEIREVPGENKDYEYDPTVYTLTYTVEGKDVKQQVRIGDDVIHDHSVVFENTWLHGPGTVHPQVRKAVTGDPNRDDVFIFRLKAENAVDKNGKNIPVGKMPMPVGAVDGMIEITVNGAGHNYFGMIAFNKPGTYVYSVTEVKGNASYLYDSTIYTITYDVEERTGSDGKNDGITVKTTVLKNGEPVNEAVFSFTNTWVESSEEDDPGINFFRLDFPLPLTGITTANGFPRSEKPASVNYRQTDMELSIPVLSVLSNIVDVDLVDGEFPVQWLERDVALLEGTDRPGEGISVIAGHNTLNAEEFGPFAALRLLDVGDRFFVNNGSQLLIFEVYANEKIGANDSAALWTAASEFNNTLTLLTCEDELIEGGYASRRIVAAKLVK